MLKSTIVETIRKAGLDLFEVNLNAEEIQLDHPTLEKFGDYTTNVALKIVKFVPGEGKQSPYEIAKKLVEKVSESEELKNKCEKIEVVQPGFINFHLSDSYLYASISNDEESTIEVSSNERMLIEYVGPNTNKPLHIGHVRNATIGQALVNLEVAVGNKVTSANINNDRGIHIIKSMYGYLVSQHKEGLYKTNQPPYETLLKAWMSSPHAWKTPQETTVKPDHLIGESYIVGNEAYELSAKAQEEKGEDDPSAPHIQMQQMLKAWEEGDSAIRTLWKTMNSWFYEGMHQTLKNLGVHSPNDPGKIFDKEWYESEIYDKGKEIILNNLGETIVEHEDGHVEAHLEKYNLPNVVLLRKNKTTLYITQDIELMRRRIKDDGQSKVVIITANEQDLRFKQLYAICEELGIAKLEQMVHIGYGMVRTPQGKMSSRTGNVVNADELIQEVASKAYAKINEERASYTQKEKEEISRMVAIAAIKYGILKYNPMSNIIFDIEKNLDFEGETGPYLQYTHARASSILQKYVEKFGNKEISFANTHLSGDEKTLARHLQKYTDWVKKSANAYSPNYLCEYLFMLSQKFNAFYANCQIINEEDPAIRELRMILTQKTRHTLRQGLQLLGIEAPEKM